MTDDVHELIPLYALGILEAEEVARLEAAVARDPALRAELDAYQQTTTQLVVPVTPSPDVKSRLLASIGGGRHETFATRMASLFDVTLETAREYLGLIERPASWMRQMPGISLVHFAGGARYATADCGFIRMTPGTIFPPHTHMGEETSVVLTGTIRDMATGRLLGPGDELIQAEGSAHHLLCEGTEDCIFAARAIDGIEVAGAPARPSRS